MARGKIQMKRVENPVHRQVTFCKRRAGLLKKAKELSVLCDADIGVFIFSAHGKLYELATRGTMQGLIERYLKTSRGAAAHHETDQPPMEMQPAQDAKEEIIMLKQEIEILQKGLRYMFGGGAETMTLDEILVLEKHLELWMVNVRSAKMDMMLQEINVLRNKEGILEAANKYLQDKIEEHTVIANFDPVTTNIDYPLIIPNQYISYS
ncbi:hypothetical protein ACOSP7_009196 [Xanthoceras sorbifolium]